MSKPIITSFSDDFTIGPFECGDKEVNDYLNYKASSQEREKITKIYVIIKDQKIIAFSALFCSHLYFKLPQQEKEFRVPGVCIGQLGVDIHFQNKGLGKVLIQQAISLAYKISNLSGCRILYVEAHDNAVEYYKRLHFYLIESKPNRNRMFFDLIL